MQYLSDMELQSLIMSEKIIKVRNDEIIPVTDKQVQPASIDLTLGKEIWELSRIQRLGSNKGGHNPTSFCGKGSFILGTGVDSYTMSHFDRSVLLVELEEQISVDFDFSRYRLEFSAKSSVGRCHVSAQVVCGISNKFDVIDLRHRNDIPAILDSRDYLYSIDATENSTFYQGYVKLYAMIRTHSFPIQLEAGQVLVQMKVVDCKDTCGEINYGVHQPLTLDLQKSVWAKRGDCKVPLNFSYGHPKFDLEKYFYKCDNFPMKNFGLAMSMGDFYLVSTQPVSVSSYELGQVTCVDLGNGNFRPHYAGFVDPGFGGKAGLPIVLEISPNEDMILYDGDEVANLVKYPLSRRCDVPYNGFYTDQIDTKPSKIFKVNQ